MPILAISGFINDEVIEEVNAIENVNYLSKPFLKEELLSRHRRHHGAKLKHSLKIFSQRYLLNYLVITIMVFMAAITSFFIYSNMHLKDRITYRIVRQSDIISNLISRSTTDLMREGHDKETYATILEYGNLIGVQDIAIFDLNGREAFDVIGDRYQRPRRARRSRVETQALGRRYPALQKAHRDIQHYRLFRLRREDI